LAGFGNFFQKPCQGNQQLLFIYKGKTFVKKGEQNKKTRQCRVKIKKGFSFLRGATR